jgi:transposase
VLALSTSCRYFLYGSPTDMRFGINSLSGLVRNRLGADPMNGDVFIFIGKRSNQVRLLQWDGDGFALYIKKLERGTFERPRLTGTAITSTQLTLLLQGVRLESVRYRSRYTPLKRV